MTGATLARIGALVVLGVAVAATLLQMTRQDDPAAQDRPAFLRDAPGATDPLRVAQRRCQLLGEAARGDADCFSTWAITRDRFLGRQGADSSPRIPARTQPQTAE